ncbi:MAG: divalent-cation tolerance protein CutA [Pseudoxanthomonas sp.]
MDLIAVFTTVADAAQAQAIADAAVAQGLAACVQTEPVHSTYRWAGALRHEPEVRLMFKTTRECYPALERLVLALHPYELPALYALPVTTASGAYRDWVIAATSQPTQ